MTEKEISTELIKLGNDFAIPLPKTFCEGTTLEEGVDRYVRNFLSHGHVN